MKICIPTSDARELDSTIHGHFGSAPHLALINLQDRSIEFLARDSSGGCGSALQGHQVDAVFCQGMGQGALTALERQGIPVYVTTASTLHEALHAILNDEVRRLGAAQACHGHDHGHDHGGGCCGGH